ncbi:transposase family protein [Xenorhabdus bakwenae]|uniref:transposase family protein n=1 Tax=Xenorhabdus bakwenae TaxID=3026967 RepID=UPI003DA0345A
MFSEIQDPHQSAKVAYPLFDILFASLCAMIAGAESWHDIQEYPEGYAVTLHRTLDIF